MGMAAALALSAGGWPASAQGPQPPTLELVGQIAGPADAVAVQGNYAYVGAGPRLAIVDVSNPAQPAIVGQTEDLGATIAGIAVTADHAYVAAGVAGLYIFSLADPTQPTQVGSFRTPAGHTEGVAVAGNYAYLTNRFDGLRIVDVSDPAQPVEVGSYAILVDAVDVALAGVYAYVTDLRGGLRILDVSDPAQPVEVGVYHPPGFATGVAVVGERAYVTASSTGLRVVDIADPTQPVEIGFYDTPGTSALDVAVADNLAYVADVETLRVIDVSTPTQPFEATFYDPAGFVVEVAVSGDLVYLAASGAGMLILRLQRPGPPPAGAFTLARGGGLPAVAALPGSDRFLVVWDTGPGLRARFVDTAGRFASSEFPPTAGGGQAGIPALTANPASGEFLVTWWDFRAGPGDIFGQRLAADGSLIGGEFLIAQAANFENWPPAVAYLPTANEYLVVWYQEQDETGDLNIYGQRISAAGARIGDVLLINSQGTPQVRPAVAANSAAGEYLVVWSLIGPGPQGEILGQRLAADGLPLGGATPIGQGDKAAVTYNSISGEYMLVEADGTAQAVRLRPDGSVAGSTALSAPGAARNFSDLAVDASGGYVTVWEGPDGGQDMSNVFGREVSAGGELRGAQVTFDDRPSSGQLLYPAIAYNAQANVYLVAWESQLDGQRTVRARIYTPGQAPPPAPAGLVNGDFEDGFYLLNGQSIANGWAPYTLLGQPSFAGERSTRNGGQWAYKLSGYAPFMAGLAQVISVQPGRTYQVTVYYQLYPPGDGQAFLGVQDGTAPGQWVGDSQPGVWKVLTQVVTPTSDRLTISLQGNSGALPNTNVYFDDATVVVVGQ
jgi:hypothetical protein